jgi:hypothetical protein
MSHRQRLLWSVARAAGAAPDAGIGGWLERNP